MHLVQSKHNKLRESVMYLLIPVKGSRLFSVLILCVFLQVGYSKLLVSGFVES